MTIFSTSSTNSFFVFVWIESRLTRFDLFQLIVKFDLLTFCFGCLRVFLTFFATSSSNSFLFLFGSSLDWLDLTCFGWLFGSLTFLFLFGSSLKLTWFDLFWLLVNLIYCFYWWRVFLTYLATVHSPIYCLYFEFERSRIWDSRKKPNNSTRTYPRIVIVYSNVPNIRRIPIDFVGVSVMIGII